MSFSGRGRAGFQVGQGSLHGFVHILLDQGVVKVIQAEPAAAPAAAACVLPDNVKSLQAEVLAGMNAQRRARGLPALQMDATSDRVQTAGSGRFGEQVGHAVDAGQLPKPWRQSMDPERPATRQASPAALQQHRECGGVEGR